MPLFPPKVPGHAMPCHPSMLCRNVEHGKAWRGLGLMMEGVQRAILEEEEVGTARITVSVGAVCSWAAR